MIFEFKFMVAIMLYLTSIYYNFIKYFWPSGNYQTTPVPDNSCKIFAGVKTGEYPFEHWNAPPSTYDEVNKGVSTLLASQHRMGWHNWCAGDPNSGSSSSCNIFYGEKFSLDNYCWFVLIQRAISSNKPLISLLSNQG